MKKAKKVVKLNKSEILSIICEHFNGSKDKYIPKQVQATHLNLFGTGSEDLRLVCVLTNDDDDDEIFQIDLEEIDKIYDFTGDASVELKSK